MKLAEFKAWFDGFTESIPADKGFTAAQAKRIRDRVAEIDDTAMTWPIYIDRFVHPHRPYYDASPVWVSGTRAGDIPDTPIWNSGSASRNEMMLLAGRADAASLIG